jgi:hypothetical protein
MRGVYENNCLHISLILSNPSLKSLHFFIELLSRAFARVCYILRRSAGEYKLFMKNQTGILILSPCYAKIKIAKQSFDQNR